MKVEIIKKPAKLSKSNSKWLEVIEQFLSLKPDECLKIAGLNKKELNSLHQQAYREVKARRFVRKENGEDVLYLYKPK